MPHQYTSQPLTVLYCDLVDSTYLSRRLDPEDLREVVRAYQQASATVIARYRGYIAPYQGDALLVYFGYPQPSPDDPQRAVHTALGILAMLDDLNARLAQTHGVRIAVRLGIHTGPVVVAALGDAVRQEQLALGETSTIAAGIQGLAAPDSVVVSAATARLLQDAFVCDSLGAHSVKGVTEPMAVLRVQAAHTTALSQAEVLTPASSGGMDDAERRHLTVMFCDIADTAHLAPRLATDALLAVVQAFQERGAAVVARYDGYIAQYLDNGLLIYFGFPRAHEDDAQRAVHTGLEIVEAMPDLNAHIASQVSVQVATRIGIYTGRAVAGSMGGGSRIEQLAAGDTPNVAARIHGLAAPNTVLLGVTTARLVQGYFVCEDLGTYTLKGVAEPMPVVRVRAATEAQTRLDVAGAGGLSGLVGRERELQQLMARWEQSRAGQGQAVLLSGEAGIGKSRLVETMRERPQVEGVIAHVTRSRRLPTDILEQIIARTDGIPLFVEELTKTILESGVLRAVNGHYELTGPASAVAIPETLQDSLLARLDRLGAAKRVAQVAAVIGREFSYDLLAAVSQREARTLSRELEHLVQADLVTARVPQASYHEVSADCLYGFERFKALGQIW